MHGIGENDSGGFATIDEGQQTEKNIDRISAPASPSFLKQANEGIADRTERN